MDVHFFPKYFLIHLLLELGHILGRSIKAKAAVLLTLDRGLYRAGMHADSSLSMHIVATSGVNHRPERLRVCVGGAPHNRGTQSSAINYPGQLLDALMYFMLWEPALCCALQTYQSQVVESPRGSRLSHSVTGALVLLPQSEFTHGGRAGSSFMPESNPVRGRVLSLVLCTAEKEQ